jgi:hypothetical protein
MSRKHSRKLPALSQKQSFDHGDSAYDCGKILEVEIG